MPEPYGRQTDAGHTMDKGESERGLGRLSGFSPKTEPIEAPGSCPTYHGPEEHAVDPAPQTAEAHFVVVPGKETYAARVGKVAPIA